MTDNATVSPASNSFVKPQGALFVVQNWQDTCLLATRPMRAPVQLDFQRHHAPNIWRDVHAIIKALGPYALDLRTIYMVENEAWCSTPLRRAIGEIAQDRGCELRSLHEHDINLAIEYVGAGCMNSPAGRMANILAYYRGFRHDVDEDIGLVVMPFRTSVFTSDKFETLKALVAGAGV